MKKINILRGTYGKNRISNTTFNLVAPVKEKEGVATAVVDASDLLGEQYKHLVVEVQDYRLLE